MTSNDFVKVKCSELRQLMDYGGFKELRRGEFPRFPSSVEACWSNLGCEKQETRALLRQDQNGKPIKIMIWSPVHRRQ